MTFNKDAEHKTGIFQFSVFNFEKLIEKFANLPLITLQSNPGRK